MDCTPFERVRLRFLNTLGSWDYLNFNLNSTQSYRASRQEYEKVLGDYSGTTFSYGQSDRGQSVSDVVTIETKRIQSDIYDESYNSTFQELLSSREVYIMEGVIPRPVIIQDSNKQMIKKIDQQMIRYDFRIEYSNEIISA